MSKRMLRRWWFWVVLVVVVVVVAYIVWGAWPPKRPTNVPKGAVYVATAKIGFWDYCKFDPVQRTDHCQIFFTDGSILSEDDFLPYDGGTAVGADELKIDPHTHFADLDRIILRNGRILLPKSRYDDEKKFWDGMCRNWRAPDHSRARDAGINRFWDNLCRNSSVSSK